MPRSRKPKQAPLLAAFLSKELEERAISLRAAARGIGISHSHLIDIIAGRKVPDAGVCGDIALFFDVAKLKIYLLAGWINQDDLDAIGYKGSIL